jgi:hypothetical protein
MRDKEQALSTSSHCIGQARVKSLDGVNALTEQSCELRFIVLMLVTNLLHFSGWSHSPMYRHVNRQSSVWIRCEMLAQ